MILLGVNNNKKRMNSESAPVIRFVNYTFVANIHMTVPGLRRTVANMSPRRMSQSIIDQFGSYQYINYGKTLVHGHIRQLFDEKQLSLKYVSFIADLCKLYFYDAEDGYDQLAYQIFAVLKKCNKKSFNKHLLQLIVRKYLKIEPNGDYKSKIRYHCDELIRLKYIIPTDEKDESYTFSISSMILFNN